MGRRRHPDFYCAPFPLYTIRIHPESGLVITAGGGGASKTGIKNAVHFLWLERISDRLSASLLLSYDTETRATMTMALAGDMLAAGQDASCHILRWQTREEKNEGKSREKTGNNERGARKRKPSKSSTDESKEDPKNETPEISPPPTQPEISLQPLHVVQTDFSPDTLQKAVCFSQDCTKLLTGGADGYLRVWEFPGMEKLLDCKAHNGEIEDITVSPGSK
ncbi:guanine nucleotide-exchange factor SEC12, partial [Ascaphus truei]|uniref:guanine nucleotide-exchange factor SEC12 n=1 Tax=Ascaphus truei TaxID=8439 RepID=UPI003F59031A